MYGQGSPACPEFCCSALRRLMLGVLLVITNLLWLLNSALGDESLNGTRLRINWGGEQITAWKGRFDFPPNVQIGNLRILGLESDQSGRIYQYQNSIIVDLKQATRFGGFEIEVVGDPESNIQFELAPVHLNGKDSVAVDAANDSPETRLEGEFQLDEILSDSYSKESGFASHRVVVFRASGDDIKFLSNRDSMVFSPNEKLTLPLGISQNSRLDFSSSKKLQVALRSQVGGSKPIWTDVRDVEGPGDRFDFEIEVPATPGVYHWEASIIEPFKIPFSPAQKLVSRSIQFVVPHRSVIKTRIDHLSNLELVFEDSPGRTEWLPRLLRFRQLDRLSDSTREMIKKHLPIPTKPGGDYFEVEAESWKIFPLQFHSAQDLLLFEIDCQLDSDGLCDFVLLDRTGQRSYAPVVVNSFRDVSADSEKPERNFRTNRFLTWTHSKSPLLLVRNASADQNARIKKIRVFKVNNEQEAFVFSTNQHRRLMANISVEHYSRMLAAPMAAEKQIELHDWQTFMVGGERLIRLLNSSGYQGVVLDVNENGSSIYPSAVLQATPGLDTGVFSASAKDPIRKDVLELLFRQFNANSLTLIPRLQIPENIAELEALRHEMTAAQFQDMRLQTVDGKLSTAYNVLHPKVQAIVRRLIVEITNRYSHHPSFGGISLQVGGNNQLTFVDAKTGYNDFIVDRFLQDQTIQLVSNGDFPSIRHRVYAEKREEFLSWRADQYSKFFDQLNQDIGAATKKRLILDTSDTLVSRKMVFGSSGFGSQSMADLPRLFPTLRGREKPIDLNLPKGIDVTSLNKANVGLMLSVLESAATNHADKRSQFAIGESMSLVKALNESKSGDDKLERPHYFNVQRVILPRAERISDLAAGFPEPSVPRELTYYADVANSNDAFRRELVRQIARQDALLMVDSSFLSARALSSDAKRIWSTYTKLPNIAFETVTRNNLESPVVVRMKSVGEKSYLYVVNQSPWSSRVAISFTTPVVNLRSVTGDFFNTLEKNENGARLTLELEPFDLVAAVSDQKEMDIGGVQISQPAEVKEELIRQKDLLLAKIRFLPEPTSISNSSNTGFESVDQRSRPQGWSFLEDEDFQVAAIEVDTPNGSRALELTNTADEKWGWIRGGQLAIPRTGRLSLLVSMKLVDGQTCPQVRLSLDGNRGGKEYYRFGSFSAEENLPLPVRIESEWKVFAVHFNDVPTDLSDIRVGMDILGKGAVLVDNFRVFDRWFDASDQQSLTKIVTLAAHKISEGELLQAHQLLNSYWPAFIGEYVPSNSNSAKDASAVPIDIARQPQESTTSEKPAAEAQSSRK